MVNEGESVVTGGNDVRWEPVAQVAGTGLTVDLGPLVQQAIDPAVQKATKGIQDLTVGLVAAAQADISTANGRLDALEAQAAAQVSAALPGLTTSLVGAATTAFNDAAHDVWIPRGVVGILGAVVLLIVGFYCAGSHRAADIVGWLIPAFGGLAAIAGRMVLASATGKAPTPPAS